MGVHIKGFFFSLFTIIFYSYAAQGQHTAQQRWVDSVYNQLSLEEKVGQLFMVAAYSGGKSYNETQIAELVKNGLVGGLIYMQGTPRAQAAQTNKHQQNSKVPLLIAMDAEWGLGMRLTGVADLPRQMMMGAAADSALVYKMAAAIAQQCKRLGVHINFAPVIDVNNNPRNPVINFRSFGENKYEVARLGVAYMKGLQDNGVMACAKHFPGHGDTETDSHKDLPIITKSRAEMDSLELYPFRVLIKEGIQSIMVAHMEVPTLESKAKLPTTLSYSTITQLLKKEMGFDGLVFTDALNMQGVAKSFSPGEVDLLAFKAGNDVLLFSQNVPLAVNKITQAIRDKSISEKQLAQSVKKILAAKYEAGLHQWQPLSEDHIESDINAATDNIKREAARKAIAVVKDENNLLDKWRSGTATIQYIGVNENNSSPLWERIKMDKGKAQAAFLPKGSTGGLANTLKSRLNQYDVNLVVVHNMSFYPGINYGLDTRQMTFLKEIADHPKVLMVINGNPYIIKNFCDVRSVVVAYEDDGITQGALADILMGTYPAAGMLPVTVCNNIKATAHLKTTVQESENISGVQYLPVEKKKQNGKSLSYSTYEVVGVRNAVALGQLDNFINECINAGVFPGCRILAAKDGQVFYNKAFGKLTYNSTAPVTQSTLYDVASVTKILATTLAVMRLYEQGKLKMDARLGDYLSWTKGSDKANLVIKDLLLHQAGLKSWIPFYRNTLDSEGNWRPDIYRRTSAPGYTYQVAKGMYIKERYNDSVWDVILSSPLENKGRYVYSDLDFYFLAAVVEQISGQALHDYVYTQFYTPMGLKHLLFNPLRKFPLAQIAPTEDDEIYRKQLVHGYVHDPGAAMLGGIAGHAGLFSTAQDVAAVFQMLLDDGVYNHKRYFKKATVDYFTRYNTAKSRRGLGFDKPNPSNTNAGPVGDRVSSKAFGHQGFTGTCAWADPESGIVFVLLSNRVHPNAENNGINRKDVRTKAQDYIYEAFNIPINNRRTAAYPY